MILDHDLSHLCPRVSRVCARVRSAFEIRSQQNNNRQAHRLHAPHWQVVYERHGRYFASPIPFPTEMRERERESQSWHSAMKPSMRGGGSQSVSERVHAMSLVHSLRGACRPPYGSGFLIGSLPQLGPHSIGRPSAGRPRPPSRVEGGTKYRRLMSALIPTFIVHTC